MRQRRVARGETSCDCSDHPTMCACAIEWREEPMRREEDRVCLEYCIEMLEENFFISMRCSGLGWVSARNIGRQ